MASGVFCQLEVNTSPVYTIHNKNKTSTCLSFNYVRQPTVQEIQVSSVTKKASKGELNEIITKFVLNCVDRQNAKTKSISAPGPLDSPYRVMPEVPASARAKRNGSGTTRVEFEFIRVLSEHCPSLSECLSESSSEVCCPQEPLFQTW